MPATTTRDIGLAIRDFMEARELKQFDDDQEIGADIVEFIDVSDPHNPVIYMDSGQTFTVRVIAGGGGT